MLETRPTTNDDTHEFKVADVQDYMSAHGVPPLPEEDPVKLQERIEQQKADRMVEKQRIAEIRAKMSADAAKPRDPMDDTQEIDVADMKQQIRMQEEADARAGDTQRIEGAGPVGRFLNKIFGK